MKIYTKTGDKGQTSLVGGSRVSKSSKRVNAYGTIDELNSFMGLLRCKLTDESTKEFIHILQKSMFSVGGILATPTDYKGKPIDFDVTLIEQLEQRIDEIGKDLPPFRCFLAYGENEISSIAHICRAVARRAERCMVELAEEEPVDENLMRYINRLSDYLYMLGLHLA